MQRKSEWLDISDLSYHVKQFDNPYRSTIAFCKWLDELGLFSKKNAAKTIADLGAGMGANTYYLAQRFTHCNFIGLELNDFLVKEGNQFLNKKNSGNCKLERADFYHLPPTYHSKFSGIISFQVLSWLPDWEIPIKKMIEMNPDWIAFSSLFFEGNVNCRINVRDFNFQTGGNPYHESYYNIYSLKHIKKMFKNNGFTHFDFISFLIDIDLPNNNPKGMGTHTEILANGKRIQLSGPLFMPWYFVLARK